MGMVRVYEGIQDYEDELRRMTKRILDLVQENEALTRRLKALEAIRRPSGSSRSGNILQ